MRTGLSRRWVSTVSVLALAAAVTSGCGISPPYPRPEPSASYSATPDEDLYARIAALPGVEDVSIAYHNDINGRQYLGTVFVADGGDAPVSEELLDQVNAILWQGRPQVDITVTVSVGTPQDSQAIATQRSLGLDLGHYEDLVRRYGPQPGTGIPPSTPPSPAPS